MKVNDREIGFAYTVGAAKELEALKTERGAADLRALVEGDGKLDAMADVVLLLSRWHEKKRALEEQGYAPQPLTREETELLPLAALYTLFGEAMDAMQRDQTRSVEIGDTQKKRAAAAPSS